MSKKPVTPLKTKKDQLIRDFIHITAWLEQNAHFFEAYAEKNPEGSIPASTLSALLQVIFEDLSNLVGSLSCYEQWPEEMFRDEVEKAQNKAIKTLMCDIVHLIEREENDAKRH